MSSSHDKVPSQNHSLFPFLCPSPPADHPVHYPNPQSCLFLPAFPPLLPPHGSRPPLEREFPFFPISFLVHFLSCPSLYHPVKGSSTCLLCHHSLHFRSAFQHNPLVCCRCMDILEGPILLACSAVTSFYALWQQAYQQGEQTRLASCVCCVLCEGSRNVI